MEDEFAERGDPRWRAGIVRRRYPLPRRQCGGRHCESDRNDVRGFISHGRLRRTFRYPVQRLATLGSAARRGLLLLRLGMAVLTGGMGGGCLHGGRHQPQPAVICRHQPGHHQQTGEQRAERNRAVTDHFHDAPKNAEDRRTFNQSFPTSHACALRSRRKRRNSAPSRRRRFITPKSVIISPSMRAMGRGRK